MLSMSGSPAAVATVCIAGIVVLGLVLMVAITSWKDVRIAQATGQAPKGKSGAPGPGTVDRLDQVGHPSGGPAN